MHKGTDKNLQIYLQIDKLPKSMFNKKKTDISRILFNYFPKDHITFLTHDTFITLKNKTSLFYYEHNNINDLVNPFDLLHEKY